MHHIAFNVVSTDEWFGDAIEFEIDGMNFLDMVRDFEMPLAAAEGTPTLAGGYMGMAAISHLAPSRHFGGIDDSPERRERKMDLLWCRDCGEPGCWPLRAAITAHEGRIVWSHFEQPHRASNGLNVCWSYDAFGPFLFDRSQYESSLAQAAFLFANRRRD